MELLEQRAHDVQAAPREAARRTLAMRIAHRNRLRAERLARLRPEAAAGAARADAPPLRAIPPAEAAGEDAGAALEEFLRALTGSGAAPPPDAVEPPPAAVLRFQRGPAAAGDLARLPGMGPSLAWAFGRAGIASLAELARLQEAELVARLGPLGRLVPAAAWLAAARAAAEAEA